MARAHAPALLVTVAVLVAVSAPAAAAAAGKPNVLFILADDVGWADVGFAGGRIATPNLDRLAGQGVKLTQHHVHSTCTPSRASLMTGRYSANIGVTFAMLPGSLAGLPPDQETLPEVLAKEGYAPHMVGKWHIGNAQWRQTPVGRGFRTHVGSYMWSMEYYRKQMWELPWLHFAIDWVRADANGTYSHYAEPRHTTTALTEEAIERIRSHAAESETTGEPLFLYLAYTAAHAPLEPLPQDEADADCAGRPHEWRRKFCGLMKGLDRGVGQVVAAAQEALGDNTVIVFTSDNGGAPWFGGLNEPLRSGKTTPFQGGVRVPAFALDLTPDSRYLGSGGRTFEGLAHISDWLPTLATMAGADAESLAAMGLDGMDIGPALRNGGKGPRRDVLLEMYYHSRGEFLFPEDVAAFRRDNWKLVESVGMRDAHWYSEPTQDALNSTDTSRVTRWSEAVLRWLEARTTAGKFDSVRDLAVHLGIHALFRGNNPGVDAVMLFDLDEDPGERRNVAAQHPGVVADLRARMYALRDARPRQLKWWMTIDRDRYWADTLQRGDCSPIPAIQEAHCRFAHPWVPDDADLAAMEGELVDGSAAWPFVRSTLGQAARVGWPYLLGLVAVVAVVKRLRRRGRAGGAGGRDAAAAAAKKSK